MSKKRALFEDDEGEEDTAPKRLEINESYAKSYDERKAKELLSNKKAYSLFAQGEDLDEDGEAASSEDEFAEDLTPDLDNQIAQTIALIRSKDPKIYRKDFEPFKNVIPEKPKPATKEKKPVLYQDLIREKVKRGEAVDEDSESEGEGDNSPSYFEQQEKLKREFQLAAGEDANDDDDDDEGFVLKMKPSSHDLPPPISKTEEDFLFKYLSDRNQWSTQSAAAPVKRMEEDEDDEEEEERAEEFEQQFLFRHLDPSSSEIVSHGRKIEGSLRRKENTRKAKRDEAEQRKHQLADSKREELKRLKNLKRKMIEKELIEAFGQPTKSGAQVLDKFGMDDLEGDFDPATWDSKMSQVFDDQYYKEEDEAFAQELEQEEEGDEGGVIEEEGDVADDQEQEEEAYEEEPVRPLTKHELKQMVEERLAKEEEENEEAEPEFKFHYRQVEPNDYGIDETEVLQATNQELNAFVSLKRMAPFADKEWLASAQHRKKFRDRLKQRRQEAAQATSKKEKERLRVAKNRFEKSKQATLLTTTTTEVGIKKKPAAMSSARLKSFVN